MHFRVGDYVDVQAKTYVLCDKYDSKCIYEIVILMAVKCCCVHGPHLLVSIKH